MPIKEIFIGANGGHYVNDDDSSPADVNAAIAAHAALAAGVNKVLAFGFLSWTGAAFVWALNEGFGAVGGADAPVHNGVGNWSVTVLAAAPNRVIVGFMLGNPGFAYQNGPFVGNVANVLVGLSPGSPSNPAGWGAGALLGQPVPDDASSVLLICYGG